MRFMMLMIPKGYENAAPGTTPDPKAVEAMMKYNEELQKAGVLLDVSGLKPSSAGVRVRFGAGKRTIIDGPFTESKELIAGYWVIQVKSREEAIEWAKRIPAELCEIEEVELRPIQELDEVLPGAAPRA